MALVVILGLTRLRGSTLQLVLASTTLVYGVIYAALVGRSASFHPLLALYGLPALVGGLGIWLWIRSRGRR